MSSSLHQLAHPSSAFRTSDSESGHCRCFNYN